MSGSVLVNGAPAEGAKVVFYPTSEELKQPGMPIPYAFTGPDGQFKLRSYDPDDGAPAGDYNVSVFWPKGGGDQSAGGGEMEQVSDRLGNRFLNPKESGLTATVDEGGAELPPFELK